MPARLRGSRARGAHAGGGRAHRRGEPAADVAVGPFAAAGPGVRGAARSPAPLCDDVPKDKADRSSASAADFHLLLGAGDRLVRPVRGQISKRPGLELPRAQDRSRRHAAHAAGLDANPAAKNRIAVSTSSAPALAPSAQWMPSRLPPSPTLTPLKVRMPSPDMAYSPITRPRIGAGARSCTRVWAMALNASSRKPATNSSASASAYERAAANAAMAAHQSIASTKALRARAGKRARLSSSSPAARAPAASAPSSML